MKTSTLFTAILAFGISLITDGQTLITGKVVDSVTREPLAGASVFFQNTTIGTVTNKQGEFSLSMRSGGYDLVVTYTGYQTKMIRITHEENSSFEIAMIKEEKNMEEVVIRS